VTDEEFTVEVEGDVIRLRGDLDAHTASLLDDAIREVVESGAERVVLDLAEVGFVDSRGLRSMVQARGPAGERDVVLRSPSRAAARILEITGLDDHFRIET
jgi:anti-anti-sigma factor